MLGGLIDRILLEGADQKLGIKDVDAHRGQVAVWLIGLLSELEDLLVVVLRDDTEAGCLLPGNGHDGNGEIGLMPLVVVEHSLIVHVVELITREDQDILGIMLLDKADILRHGVGRARIPRPSRLGGIRGQDGDATVALVQIPSAAGPQVRVKQVRTILREYPHRLDPRVRAV